MNICSNDLERTFEAVIQIPFLIATPTMFVLALIYSVVIIGPIGLVGLLILFLFYPAMVSSFVFNRDVGGPL